MRYYDDPTVAAEHGAEVERHERLAARAFTIGSRIGRIGAIMVLGCLLLATAVVVGAVARLVWNSIRLGWGL